MRSTILRDRGLRETISKFVSSLKQCSKVRDLQAGKKIHADAAACGLHTNKYVGTALVTMYSKCGCMTDAQDLFDRMVHRDVVTWTCLITGYVEKGENLTALQIFSSMSCEPDPFTLVSALKACAGLAQSHKKLALEKGMVIHRQVNSRKLDTDVVVATGLVDMYSKCGVMGCARDVFDRMVNRNVVSWTCLILGYVENGESLLAMETYVKMDCEPNSVTLIAALKACASLGHLEKGLALHKQVREYGFETEISVLNTLLDMYGKCGTVLHAREVFDRMTHRDVVSWNCLILGYVANGESSVALDLFATMDSEPDGITYAAALKACAFSMCLDRGVAIHKEARERGFDTDIVVANSLLNMYVKCGSVVKARDVFDRMTHRDAASWTCLIQGYGETLVGIELFKKMDCEPDAVTFAAALKACTTNSIENGVAIHRQARDRGFHKNILVANTLLDMYSKAGSVVCAREIFDQMIHRDVISWNCLLMGYVENGESSIAVELFNRIDCEANSVTYVAALMACGTLSALPTGRSIHARICGGGMEQNAVVANSLLDFYGKCGDMLAAKHVFDGMQCPDIVSWNTLIAGYSTLGETFHVFSSAGCIQEAGLQMDGVTLVCILTVCSHAGMLEEGRKYFEYMFTYGIRPSVEHHTCVVDMLGRANRLQEALDVVNRMVEADDVTWSSLLGASRKWKNLSVGKLAFDKLVSAKAHGAAAYVMIRDIYENFKE